MNRDTLRRIVLFLDGTWNDDSDRGLPTNVVRLHEALKIGVDARKRSTAKPPSGRSAQGSAVEGRDGRDVEYVVHYDSGVGTGVLDRLPGGAFGRGLDDNIREAYRFLSKHYRPGDEIHLFGFSRGAFTARSIVGYLFATGLLTAENCTAEREEQAWRFYRTSPDDRHSGDWHELEPFLHPAGALTVKCVGVFDTVGALGIPLDGFRLLNARRYAFHDTNLSPIVEYSFHAVAIDEHRRSFEATLWHKPLFKEYLTAKAVEQVWFPGAHADIGGGYSDWDKGQDGRQDIAFAWMVRRVRDCVKLDFPEIGPSGPPPVRCDDAGRVLADIHRPWNVLDGVRLQACRAINEVEPLPSPGIPDRTRGTKSVGLTRHEDPIGEMIHISALSLLADPKGVIWEKLDGPRLYRPPNLIAVLPLVAGSYRAWDPQAWAAWKPYADALARGASSPPTLYVVDWDGRVIPADPAERADGHARPNVFAFIGQDPSAFGLRS